ncbi:hypothetical protein [Halopseudomonas bauzanensis]|uniref:hypothetical protein n=1 Tax=Halopseudomonas bauzanensis TaxID=653930 RepID=UPI0025527187|nr:hypothetical protein [Halopseudomonas bauzanensis]
MQCPAISNLKLDLRDQEALKRIRSIQRAGNILEVIMPTGVMSVIFLGNSASQSIYNIHSTDWVLFAQAMSGLPMVIRTQIANTAKMRLLDGGLNMEQRQFWRAVEQGCGGF